MPQRNLLSGKIDKQSERAYPHDVSMNIDDLFDNLMKGQKDASLGTSSTGNADGSGDRTDFSSGIELDFGTSNLPLPSQQKPPVGNQVDLDFGFGLTSVNSEKDEDDKVYTTYSDSRSFKADVISFVERYYFDKGDLPEYRLLHETFKDYPESPRYVKGWKEVVDGIREQIENRGLPTFRTADNYLEPAFITACNILVNIHDTRSDAAKLKELGLTTAKWNAWLKSEKYNKYFRSKADQVFDEEIKIEAKRTVSKLVKNGDLSAVKYLNEWQGTYRAADNTQQMMQVFMTAILSILARNVASDVINIIGAELREDPGIKSLLGMNSIEAEAS